MDDYNLEPGEFVIMQQPSVILGSGTDQQHLDELVLTNKNLILVLSVAQGFFRRERYLKRCPLSTVSCAEDIPQTVVSKRHNKYYLQVVFDGEAIALNFPSGSSEKGSKRTAERWGEGIQQAALGNFSGIRTEDDLPPEIADLVDGAKDVFGAVLGGGKRKAEPSATGAPSRPTIVSAKCSGCHAPLTGRKGAVVTCGYCDTKQTL